MTPEQQIPTEIVNPNIETKEINLEQVIKLFSTIDSHNQEYSSATITHKAIATAVKASYPPSDTPSLLDKFIISKETQERIKSFESNQQTHFKNEEITALINSLINQKTAQAYSFNLISDRYQTLLNQLGLSIETIDKKGMILLFDSDSTTIEISDQTILSISEKGKLISSTKVSFEGKEIAYDISDQSKFISFLKSLNPESIKGNLEYGLVSILASLDYQLQSRYKLSSPNQQTLKFLKTINQILSQYERLGIKGNAKALYLHYEYLITKKLENDL